VEVSFLVGISRYLVGNIVTISAPLLVPYYCLVSVEDVVVGSHIFGPSLPPMCTCTVLGACPF